MSSGWRIYRSSYLEVGVFCTQEGRLANALRGSREQADYLSYLLRLWRVRGDEGAHQLAEKPVWRASLESPFTGERMGFASLDALFAFLRQQTSE